MRPISIGSLVLAIAISTSAHADTTPPGVNLRWDQCFGDGGVQNKSFACNTNTGTERLVASIELGSALANVSGMELYIDIGSASPAFPVWWQFKNAGSCRQASLQMNAVPPPGAPTCTEWSGGASIGGIGTYNIGAHGVANSSRLAAVIAVPATDLIAL